MKASSVGFVMMCIIGIQLMLLVHEFDLLHSDTLSLRYHGQPMANVPRVELDLEHGPIEDDIYKNNVKAIWRTSAPTKHDYIGLSCGKQSHPTDFYETYTTEGAPSGSVWFWRT